MQPWRKTHAIPVNESRRGQNSSANIVFSAQDNQSFFEKIKADILAFGFAEASVSQQYANITVQYRNHNDSFFSYMHCGTSKGDLAVENMNELLSSIKLKLLADPQVRAKLPQETAFEFRAEKSSTNQKRDRFVTGQLFLKTPKAEAKNQLINN